MVLARSSYYTSPPQLFLAHIICTHNIPYPTRITNLPFRIFVLSALHHMLHWPVENTNVYMEDRFSLENNSK